MCLGARVVPTLRAGVVIITPAGSSVHFADAAHQSRNRHIVPISFSKSRSSSSLVFLPLAMSPIRSSTQCHSLIILPAPNPKFLWSCSANTLKYSSTSHSCTMTFFSVITLSILRAAALSRSRWRLCCLFIFAPPCVF